MTPWIAVVVGCGGGGEPVHRVPSSPALPGDTAGDSAGTVTLEEIEATSLHVVGDVDGDARPDLVALGYVASVWITDPVGAATVSPFPLPFLAGWNTDADAAGDIDGDGAADVWVVGREGEAALVSGATSGVLATVAIGEEGPVGWPFRPFLTADVAGDAGLDLIVGNDVAILVFSSAVPPVGAAPDATITLPPYGNGTLVATAGDLDGDGVSDVAAFVGVPTSYDSWEQGDGDGDVYVFTAPTGALTLDDADVRVLAAAVHAETLDWDGDGVDDLAMFGQSDPYQDYVPRIAPFVRITTGPVVGGVDTTLAPAATVLVDDLNTISGETPWAKSLGQPPGSSPGDVDGDGADDLVVQTAAYTERTTFLVPGGGTGEIWTSAAAILAVEHASVATGRGDLDRDGTEDLALTVEGVGIVIRTDL